MIAQVPFIEATPAFATACLLKDLEWLFPDIAPTSLFQLMEHGIPMDRLTSQESLRWRNNA